MASKSFDNHPEILYELLPKNHIGRFAHFRANPRELFDEKHRRGGNPKGCPCAGIGRNSKQKDWLKLEKSLDEVVKISIRKFPRQGF